MSLSVNLILPNEQRSGSKINTKSALRLCTLLAPLILVVVALQQGFGYFILQTNLSIQESRWEAAEPRQNHANRQLARLNQNLRVSAEIDAWRQAQPAWDGAILAVMESTPANIQITTLRLQAVAAPDQAVGGSPPARRPSILIEGRVSEPDAMLAIEGMRNALEIHPVLQSSLRSLDVVNFAADPSVPGTPRRVFSIRIQFTDLPKENS